MATGINTATHPIDLSNGRILAPGERADDIDTDHPHQRALVVDGLLHVEEGSTPRKRQPAKRVEKAASETADDNSKE